MIYKRDGIYYYEFELRGGATASPAARNREWARQWNPRDVFQIPRGSGEFVSGRL